MKPIHYNASSWPDKTKLPACQLGGDWGRDFSGWAVTVDRERVTCKRCLKGFYDKAEVGPQR